MFPQCTLSAVGNWSTHLTRAHSILEANGGPNALRTPRVRSQVAMLVWYVSRFSHFYLDVFSLTQTRWDATLVLISRQGTIFDLVHLFHLAELAEQKELASSME